MKILHQLDRPNFKASKSDKILIRYIKEHAEEFLYNTYSFFGNKLWS